VGRQDGHQSAQDPWQQKEFPKMGTGRKDPVLPPRKRAFDGAFGHWGKNYFDLKHFFGGDVAHFFACARS
jgi:hypothetical protein